jgi:pantetheine-phosphate adenylyltransferase
VIERAIEIFDQVVVAVVANPAKEPMFSADERMAMIGRAFGDRVRLEAFDGLLVNFARSVGVDVVVKGLRAVSDFDYELQMAQMNRTLAGVETVFLPTNPEWSYLSSSLVREVARLGGAYGSLVPPHVAAALQERLA